MGVGVIELLELLVLLTSAAFSLETTENNGMTTAYLPEVSNTTTAYAEKMRSDLTFPVSPLEGMSLEVTNTTAFVARTTTKRRARDVTSAMPPSARVVSSRDPVTEPITSFTVQSKAEVIQSTSPASTARTTESRAEVIHAASTERARQRELVTKASTFSTSQSNAERVDGASLVSITSLAPKHKCPPSMALPVDPRATYPSGQVWRADGTDWYCPCNFKPCLWMCCPKGQGLKLVNFTLDCEDAPDTRLFFEVQDHDGALKRTPISNFFLRHEKICHKRRIRLEPEEFEEDRYILHANGTLSVPESKPPEYAPGTFCVGFMGNNVSEPVVLTCLTDGATVPELVTAHVMYSCFMILSLPFLVLTFVVYASLPRLQNLHGKIVMSHVAVLFTAYLTLVIVQLSSPSFSDGVCKFTAFIIYFAFLASFFWLNVMCLDIWWTFSGFRPLRGSVKEREHKKFVIYSLYCWGSPLIMLIICLIMDLHPGIPETYEKPGFGEKKCWFRSTVSNLIYFNGPIAILIVCNIVLFILTAIKICQVKRGAKILKKQDSRRHYNEEENNTQRFNLYLKLFLVMGVNWIMEVVSFAAGGPDEWWYVTDIANTLQGVLIFIIFVWKQRIRRLLGERFCPSRFPNTNSMANSSTRMTAIRRNGSEMSSGRSSLKTTQEGQPMKALPSAPTLRSDDSDIA